ncbi:MAG: alpha/beta hydrolase family protein [Parvibaculaceae bacterium]
MFEKFLIPSHETDVRLEIVMARPQGEGPHPTIIFNHGSTGQGKNQSFYARTWAPPVAASYFTDRGWMVLFPQRRGRGKSGGRYGEGLAPDGSGYSCAIEIAMAGFERAVEDLDAVMRHLRGRPDVDQNRLAIGGASRGGILAIAYAGMRPKTFRGAINFNGGWLGRACPTFETVNPMIFERGAPAGIPTLWLHGSFDQYYRIGHCRENFEKYVAAGGRGKFFAAPTGHSLLFKPALWKTHLDQYMDGLA